MRRTFLLKRAVWLFSSLCLVILGVVVSRHWHSNDPIHIHLAKNHGLETQDFFIIVSILIISIWFVGKLWQNRQTARAWIRHSPEKAALIALVLGIISGTAFGTLFGAEFSPLVKSLVKPLHQLISP